MERKEIVKVLEDHFGVKSKYMGAPSFAYQIETAEVSYTVDRAGKIITLGGKEIELGSLLNGMIAEEPIDPTTTQSLAFEVSVSMEGHNGITLKNLVNMIYSKQALIRKSLGIAGNIIEDDFCRGINEAKVDTLENFKAAINGTGSKYCPGITFDFDSSTIIFKFLEDEASSEKIQAYTLLIALLNQNAKTLKYTSAKAKDTDNDKFTFRLFLIRLGMVGDEYKITRKVLLEKLEGNSAFRYGSKPAKMSAETTSEFVNSNGQSVK